MSPLRAQMVQLLDREIGQHEAAAERLREARAMLTDGRRREVRNYDQPTADPAEIAARHGIDLHPADEQDTTPEWFEDRLRRIHDQEPQR